MLFGNNKMSIVLTKNIKSQHHTKYISISHYYIWELVNKRKFTIKLVPDAEILADRMAKPLSTKMFRKQKAIPGISID